MVDGVKGGREVEKAAHVILYVILSYLGGDPIQNIQKSSFSGVMFALSRLVMIK